MRVFAVKYCIAEFKKNVQRSAGLGAPLVAALLLGVLAAGASAQVTITVDGDINDYEAQKRSDTGVYIASENFLTGARVGFQSSFNGSGASQPGGITSVYFFKLPAVPASPNDTVGDATFSVGILPESSTGVQPTFSLDLYGLGVKDTIAKDATEAQNYWYIGATAETALPTPIGGPVSLLGPAFIVPADFIPNGSSQSTSPKTANVTAYVKSLYDNPGANSFTPGTSFLVVRLSPNSSPVSGTQRYTVGNMGTVANPSPASTTNRPKLTITFGAAACAGVPAVVASPAPVGATSAYVSGVSANASLVTVYANNVAVGSTAGSPPSTPSVLTVTTSALVDSQTFVAKQTVAGVESCVPTTIRTVGACTNVTVVSIPNILQSGATSVAVSGVDPLAGQVKIYDGATVIGTAAGSPPSTPSTVNVTTTALVAGHTINARQVVNGLERCPPTATTSGAIVVGTPTTTVLTDGFGDGDRNNDGILDNPDGSGTGVVDNAADIGTVWHKVTTTYDLKVAHDTPLDNSYNIDITNQDGMALANLPAVTLNQAGDTIVLKLKVKFNRWPTAGERDNFRFGLFKHTTTGTPISADEPTTINIENDPGYFGTMNSGSQATTRRVSRAATATGGAGLFDIAETMGSNTGAGISDALAHQLQFTIVRTTTPSIICELKLDGQSIASGESTTTPTFQFDEIGFCGVAVAAGDTPFLNVSVDDVQVLTSINPCNNPVFDTNNDGHVDITDFDVFKSCARGMGVSIADESQACRCLDIEPAGIPISGDNDLDMNDFARFQRCYTGPSVIVDPNCDN